MKEYIHKERQNIINEDFYKALKPAEKKNYIPYFGEDVTKDDIDDLDEDDDLEFDMFDKDDDDDDDDDFNGYGGGDGGGAGASGDY
jgi:hypothetical protein